MGLSKRDFIKLGLFGGMAALCPLNLSCLADDKKQLWKWNKEGYFYEKTENAVVCGICPNECIIYPGKTGTCNTHTNYEGKLYTIAYGNPCSVNIDPIEKKPFFHYKPQSTAFSFGTAGCNFKCLNCLNWFVAQASPLETKNYDLQPEKIIELAKQYKCDSIAYTFTEPTIFYEYMLDTAKLAKKNGINNLLVSNGYINPKPLEKLCEYLDAATIDIKSFKEEIYLKLNGGKLKPVLEAVKIMKKNGVWVEISNLVVPQWTDDIEMIRDMCKWLADNDFATHPLHFLRFMPIYKLADLPTTPLETLENARNAAFEAGFENVYIGNVRGTDYENTYCPNCKKLLIERADFKISQNNLNDGKCKYCNTEINGVWK